MVGATVVFGTHLSLSSTGDAGFYRVINCIPWFLGDPDAASPSGAGTAGIVLFDVMNVAALAFFYPLSSARQCRDLQLGWHSWRPLCSTPLLTSSFSQSDSALCPNLHTELAFSKLLWFMELPCYALCIPIRSKCFNVLTATWRGVFSEVAYLMQVSSCYISDTLNYHVRQLYLGMLMTLSGSKHMSRRVHTFVS